LTSFSIDTDIFVLAGTMLHAVGTGDHGIQASLIIEVPDVVAVADTLTPVLVGCNSLMRDVPTLTQ